MGLNAKTKEYTGGNRVEQDILEPGTYPARLVQVIDLGTQEQRPFKGEQKPPVQEIMVTYELADEFIKDEDGNLLEDKPRWISERFPLHNLASDLAKSTKRYYALDPDCEEDGDWTKLTGRPVMITIVNEAGKGKNEGKVYENIASTSSMRKKEVEKLPALKNPAKVFNQEDVDTAEIMLTLPQWIQDTIKKGLDWEGSKMAYAVENLDKKAPKDDKKVEEKKGRKAKEADLDDDIPFEKEGPSIEDGDNW